MIPKDSSGRNSDSDPSEAEPDEHNLPAKLSPAWLDTLYNSGYHVAVNGSRLLRYTSSDSMAADRPNVRRGFGQTKQPDSVR